MSVAKYLWVAIVKYLRTLIKIFSNSDEWSEITVDELFDRVNSDQPPLLLDVRFAEEFNDGYGHIQGARSIPILELKTKLEELDSFKDEEIVTMCPGGGMSLVAVDILTEAGFKDTKSLHGGTDLWNKSGYPTIKS
ncbi:rhodanese-like domain-containing protein [Candidatus Bathyarchaeota archaeon]|jgi:rhodanese-related sulfurtransferase|nr:rhodanese-like domain-containing protein [Candidatus Bathyarchaeota archaeon]MBT4319350.1 rhodanese-like domain-containing protein [Candidatus Bathyarchaeota archaeon]MBT4424871.1 rhodanese-like domain-containing protein [Candidatus Bathyarchaeota archaeon]MBT5643064.1 rhodanese-like domain-containing protein [Candidatus Bathyarchaeota archaeon]MBT6605777.1 rhodanese-like domain-containing protein [Candidatus Bathyarchaeota archaeon]